MSENTLRKTPLNAAHRARNARMVEFGGWDMPVQYTSIVEEHRAVRSAAGLFDVSHMGEFEFRGPEAASLLQRLTANDLDKLKAGRAQYSMFLNEKGGTIDDIMIYRTAEEVYLVVVNAANTEKDWAHVSGFAGRADVQNRSQDYALLAFQGPKTEAVLSGLTPADLSGMKFRSIAPVELAGVEVLIATTGYTGENGFEIFVAPEGAEALWNAILEAGRAEGVLPAGLGARDTLRLEASLPLYGHELDEETSPIEAGLGMFVAKSGDYIGAEAIRKQRAEGCKKRLVMLEMVDRGISRQGYPVQAADGEEIGTITSGSVAPWFDTSIAMAYVRPEFAEVGSELCVAIRNRAVGAKVVPRPYYRRPEK